MLSLLQTKPQKRNATSASASFLALFMLALLGMIGAAVLMNVSHLYNGNEKTEGWQEALFAAEAGADTALANVRWTVVPGSPTAFDSTKNWSVSPSPTPSSTPAGTIITYSYTTPTTTQAGEGTNQTWAAVTVEKIYGTTPAGLQDKYGNHWYRVRSTGHARLSGLARVSGDTLADSNARHTQALRKFSLRLDRSTGTALTTPEATRTIEQILQPKTGMLPALLADSKLKIKDNGGVDSFDSSDPAKSSTVGGFAGQYDVTKRQANGDILSNGSASDAMDLEGTHTKIYGDAGTNGSNFTNADGEIQSPGVINNSTSTKINPVPVPSWGQTGYPSINPFVSTAKNDTTITVSATPGDNYYKIDKIEKKLDIVLPNGLTTGTVNIWLTDKMTGEIHIPVGVTLNIYFSGKSFKPKDDGHKNGFDNDNLNAKFLNIYGCDPVKGNLKMDFNLHDTSLYASVYAPSADLKLKSDLKSGVSYVGSFVGDTIDAQGYFHYDEALSGLGEVIDYARASYFEDPR